MGSKIIRQLPFRPLQMDCRNEPAYPGMETVLFSIKDPHNTAHGSSDLCKNEAPHSIESCGIWNSKTDDKIEGKING